LLFHEEIRYSAIMPDLFATLAASRKGVTTKPRSVNFWLLIIFLLLFLSVSIRFLGPPSSDVAAPNPLITKGPSVRVSRTYTVTYKSGVFSPTNLRIHTGDTVIFRNDDARAVQIVSQLDPATQIPYFETTNFIVTDGTYAFTFADSGIFTYHESKDEQEAGVIIVRTP